jgi:tripartite ATP-independent transporter DctM subunit
VVVGVLALVFIVTMALGMPIAWAMVIAGLAAMIVMGPIPLQVIAQKLFTGIDSFPLMAIPFFILSGELMGKGGITERLMKLADCVVGWIRGGLGLANVLASMMFGGITGSAIADCSALGPIEIQMMLEAGYDAETSAGVTAASACIGPIIPPSIPMVVYATAVGTSIGGLFVAGIVPGIIIGVALMAVFYSLALKKNYPRRTERLTARQFFDVVVEAFPALMMPIIMLGGILGGVFTPTEAASVAVVYSLVLTMVFYKTVTLSDLRQMLCNAAITTGVVLILASTSNVFSWIITMEQVGPKLGALFLGQSKIVFLMLVNILLLFVGTWMDNCPAILILAPILAPIAVDLGIHPLHFGLIFVYNMVIGLITPPLGQVLFVACPISNLNLEEVTRGTLPFLITEIVVLLLLTYVPELTLWLPRMFGFA